jgi:hypothetical protein
MGWSECCVVSSGGDYFLNSSVAERDSVNLFGNISILSSNLVKISGN